MAQTYDEKLKTLEQKIHRLQGEKRKLEKQKKGAERKKRDHAMIVIGATFLTHFSDETKEHIINATDDEIVRWVNSKFTQN